MSNPTRNGKIARLPKPIREEINRRLENGGTARALVPWLNELPEVQTIVQTEFDGHAISEQNLSQWRKGGYEDWLRHQEAVALAVHLCERGEEFQTANGHRLPMSEVFSHWMNARYVVSTRDVERLTGEEGWRRQRQMCDDLVKMRRVEQQAEQMQIERERLELQRQRLQLQQERAETKKTGKERANSDRTESHRAEAKPSETERSADAQGGEPAQSKPDAASKNSPHPNPPALHVLKTAEPAPDAPHRQPACPPSRQLDAEFHTHAA